MHCGSSMPMHRRAAISPACSTGPVARNGRCRRASSRIRRKTLPIVDITGLTTEMPNAGAVEFDRDGRSWRLEAIGEPGQPLFLILPTVPVATAATLPAAI